MKLLWEKHGSARNSGKINSRMPKEWNERRELVCKAKHDIPKHAYYYWLEVLKELYMINL